MERPCLSELLIETKQFWKIIGKYLDGLVLLPLSETGKKQGILLILRGVFFSVWKWYFSAHYNEDIEASLWEEAVFPRTLQAVKEHNDEMSTW